MKGIIKKIQVNKMVGYVLASCIILLALSLVFCVTKGDWLGIFNNAVWLAVAFLNFKMLTRIQSLSNIIDIQERFIDRICNSIEVAKKAGNEGSTNE